MAFQHDLGFGGHLQRNGLAVHQVDLAAAQQAGELILRERVGHWCDRGEQGSRVGANHGGSGKRFALLVLPAVILSGAAAVFEPAHQGRVFAGHLHAVDAEVGDVAFVAARTFGHHQWPGDQRRRFAGPAALNRQPGEVDIVALQHHLLAGRFAHGARLHRHDSLQQRQHLQGFAPAARRLRLFEKRQRLANLTQLIGCAVHAHCDPLDRAEQIRQHGHARGAAVRGGDRFK